MSRQLSTTMPLLHGLLAEPKAKATRLSNQEKTIFVEASDGSINVKHVSTGETDIPVQIVASGSKSRSVQQKIMPRMSTTTLPGKKTSNTTKPYTALPGDLNERRGERISVSTLANYMQENKLFEHEDFIKHATQGPSNRGTEIYLKLAMKDWDKKVQQALDIARSFTPDIMLRS